MNAQELWQSQSTESPRMSLEYVRHQARRLEWRTKLRNGFEYFMSAFLISYLGWHAWKNIDKPFFAAGLACFVGFAIFCTYKWHRLATSRAAPADAGVLDTLRFQRRELKRQRDARQGSWRWWLPAFMPGCILLGISMAVEFADSPMRMLVYIVWNVVGLGLSVAFYEHSARRLQREIDALDSLAGGMN